LRIQQYSIRQGSIEQIFNNFAAKEHNMNNVLRTSLNPRFSAKDIRTSLDQSPQNRISLDRSPRTKFEKMDSIDVI